MLRDIKEYFAAKRTLIPEVETFVFGADEKALRERIAAFSTYYMFLDYGALISGRDSNNRITDDMALAVTIARPLGASLVAPEEVEEFLVLTFEKVAELRRLVLLDQCSTPWMRYLKDDHSIMPFIAPDLNRSVGATLSFGAAGFDLLRVKG